MGQWVISISAFRLSCHRVKNEGEVGRKERKAWAEVGGWSRALGILGRNWAFWAAMLDVCPGRRKSRKFHFLTFTHHLYMLRHMVWGPFLHTCFRGHKF